MILLITATTGMPINAILVGLVITIGAAYLVSPESEI